MNVLPAAAHVKGRAHHLPRFKLDSQVSVEK